MPGGIKEHIARRKVDKEKLPIKVEVVCRPHNYKKGIIEATACPDHIHMLARIPPKYSVSQIMGYLKGKSSLMIFDRHANLKCKYGNRHFWARGCYVDTVGRNKKRAAIHQEPIGSRSTGGSNGYKGIR